MRQGLHLFAMIVRGVREMFKLFSLLHAVVFARLAQKELFLVGKGAVALRADLVEELIDPVSNPDDLHPALVLAARFPAADPAAAPGVDSREGQREPDARDLREKEIARGIEAKERETGRPQEDEDPG